MTADGLGSRPDRLDSSQKIRWVPIAQTWPHRFQVELYSKSYTPRKTLKIVSKGFLANSQKISAVIPRSGISQWGALPGQPDNVRVIGEVTEDSIVDQIGHVSRIRPLQPSHPLWYRNGREWSPKCRHQIPKHAIQACHHQPYQIDQKELIHAR